MIRIIAITNAFLDFMALILGEPGSIVNDEALLEYPCPCGTAASAVLCYLKTPGQKSDMISGLRVSPDPCESTVDQNQFLSNQLQSSVHSIAAGTLYLELFRVFRYHRS